MPERFGKSVAFQNINWKQSLWQTLQNRDGGDDVNQSSSYLDSSMPMISAHLALRAGTSEFILSHRSCWITCWYLWATKSRIFAISCQSTSSNSSVRSDDRPSPVRLSALLRTSRIFDTPCPPGSPPHLFRSVGCRRRSHHRTPR